jgi:hypothetical protein
MCIPLRVLWPGTVIIQFKAARGFNVQRNKNLIQGFERSCVFTHSGPIAARYEAQLSAQDPKRGQHNDFW